MYRGSDVMRPKSKVAVALMRVDGSVLEGHVSVAGDERVIDVMNAERPFLPLEVAEGKTILINKSSVAQVEPFDQEWMRES